MSKEIMVPSHVPSFTDADKVQMWKYAVSERPEEARAWASLLEYRELAIIETAAVLLSVGDGDTDLPGLLQFLWGGLDTEEYDELVENNGGYIEWRAAKLKADNATTD